ncbi:MAG: universal stress protein [Gammaproteobacteria bacterium]|nr:universal stress protein [Gammaproteobacteria bacterium]MBV8404821.1 universal stress protein [Gammaproteobacteria bacterium]
MATRIRHILVAIGDLRRTPQAELRKAGALARAARASVELFHAIDAPDPERSFPETLTAREVTTRRAAIVDKCERRLGRFARHPALRQVTVRCTASWDYPPHDAVIRRARAAGSDLVIAAAHGHRLGARVVLRNTDWELIRHCPLPLLLVKSPRPYRRPLVLAAVDPFHRHARPANLDARLLEAGADLARLLRGSLHVFHAYMPVVGFETMALAAAPLMMLPPEVEETHTAQVTHAIGELAAKAGITPARCHIRMGEVAEELGTFARRSGAAVVVMGAVSRSAIARLFIGNAAERTLDHLRCDVLVVKPRGFRSNVERRPQATAPRAPRAPARQGRRTAAVPEAIQPPLL